MSATRQALSLFASTIKSGEPWTEACANAYARALAELGEVEHGSIVKLEGRIRQQRHVITVLQAKARERNVSMRRWYEGREALLREQLHRATAALYRQEPE